MATSANNYIIVNYYSNYATTAFAGALNTVGADKNVLVYTETYYYNDFVRLKDFQSQYSPLYMTRHGYYATGFWGTSPSGDIVYGNLDTFETGQAFAQTVGKDLSNGNASIDLYAQWDLWCYAIEYNTNGGVYDDWWPLQDQCYYNEDLYISTSKFIKTGYTPLGMYIQRPDGKWYTTELNWKSEDEITTYGYTKKLCNDEWQKFDDAFLDGVEGNAFMPVFTLHVVWTVATYTITYHSNGGSGSMSNEEKTHGQSYTVASNGFTPPSATKVNKTITLNGNGGNSSEKTCEQTTSYSFEYWTLNSTSGISYAPGSNYTIEDKATFYAKWGQSTSSGYVALGNTTRNDTTASYTVTYNYNGNGLTNTSAKATKTTKYTFKSWNSKADGTGTEYSTGSFSFSNDQTLYAQWTSSSSTTSVTLPTPTRTGYTFKGWSTSSTATSGITGSYTPTGNVTLYAVWEREKSTLFTNYIPYVYNSTTKTYVAMIGGIYNNGKTLPTNAYIYIDE